MDFKYLINITLKSAVIFIVFFFIANIFVNIQLKKIDNKIQAISEELSENLSLQKIEKEIIRSAQGEGIDPETQSKIAESLSVIYTRDILPIIIKMALKN